MNPYLLDNCGLACAYMVIVAQLVEPRIVIPAVVGSSPIGHPSFLFGHAQAVDTRAVSSVGRAADS